MKSDQPPCSVRTCLSTSNFSSLAGRSFDVGSLRTTGRTLVSHVTNFTKAKSPGDEKSEAEWPATVKQRATPSSTTHLKAPAQILINPHRLAHYRGVRLSTRSRLCRSPSAE